MQTLETGIVANLTFLEPDHFSFWCHHHLVDVDPATFLDQVTRLEWNLCNNWLYGVTANVRARIRRAQLEHGRSDVYFIPLGLLENDDGSVLVQGRIVLGERPLPASLKSEDMGLSRQQGRQSGPTRIIFPDDAADALIAKLHTPGWITDDEYQALLGTAVHHTPETARIGLEIAHARANDAWLKIHLRRIDPNHNYTADSQFYRNDRNLLGTVVHTRKTGLMAIVQTECTPYPPMPMPVDDVPWWDDYQDIPARLREWVIELPDEPVS